ncbi:efflux RND transporter periplasmic adaptor subunit [Sphingoaurantiacus capsulatus]|uniref:Efflux RND transporter periplasmic adaptor subunit n=1 Tax=Sphingoaurantiacus capsulatus TaxID=1771310 RepID=A0ABV7X7Z3_9SPHN
MATTPPPADKAGLDDFLGAKPPSPLQKYLKWGAIAVGALLVLWLLAKIIGGGEEAPQYTTVPVERGSLRVTVSATGNLQPTNQVDVGSELSGTVTEVNVDNNDKVRAGQVLARLDTSRLQDAINQARASLAAAQAGVAQARATATQERADLNRLEEVRKLSGGKVPAATELDAARAEYQRALAGVSSAEASVAQARAQLSADETQLSKAIIKSPVTGVVLSRQIEPGQTVAASLNAPVLFVIAEDLAQMQLEVKVDEADVGQVDSGQRAEFAVDAFPGRQFAASVKRVDVGANAGTASSSSTTSTSTTGQVVAYTAVLTVSNPDLTLRPGMTATAEIVTAERNGVLLVPNAALRFSPDAAARGGSQGGVTSVLVPQRPRRGGNAERDVAIGRGSKQTVYTVGADGQPTPIQVTVGDSNGSQTEVSGPQLKPGLKVITGQLASGEAAGGAAPGGGSGGRGQRGG